MPIIVHIDMNSFFASCEIKRNPALKGKEIIISGKTNRSIVSAASYEAKRKGIYTTMPYYLAKQICPNAYFFVGDHEYYAQVSEEIFSFLKKRYPLLEMASIDECYIDMSHCKIEDPLPYFQNLQKEIYEKMHIPCSIGVSYNKFLAKMASDMKKPMGITFIKHKDVPTMIWPLKIENMYGIGKASSKKLKEIQIYTIGDLVKSKELRVREILGSFYQQYIDNAMGKGISTLDLKKAPPKSVGHSYTLSFDTEDEDIIKKALYPLCVHVAQRLKELDMLGYTVTLSLKNSQFVLKNKSKKLMLPTNDADKIYLEGMKLLQKLLQSKIRLVGISISNLIYQKDYYEQLDFFNLQQYRLSQSDLFIEHLNQIAGKPVFMKAKDAQKKNEKKSNQ